MSHLYGLNIDFKNNLLLKPVYFIFDLDIIY